MSKHIGGDFTLERDPVRDLAAALAARLARARSELEGQMLQFGLHPSEGWRIWEEVRSGVAGTVIALRPIHGSHGRPDIEKTIVIGYDGRAIS
jgi:hypothetical protein